MNKGGNYINKATGYNVCAFKNRCSNNSQLTPFYQRLSGEKIKIEINQFDLQKNQLQEISGMFRQIVVWRLQWRRGRIRLCFVQTRSGPRGLGQTGSDISRRGQRNRSRLQQGGWVWCNNFGNLDNWSFFCVFFKEMVKSWKKLLYHNISLYRWLGNTSLL